MLFAIAGGVILGIVFLSVIPFQGHGVAERTFFVIFNEKGACKDIPKKDIYEFEIHSRRIDILILILLFSILTVVIIVGLIKNDYTYIVTNHPFVGTLYALPILILTVIIYRYLIIFTRKIYIYPNSLVFKDIFKKRQFLYNNINKLELYNYVSPLYRPEYKERIIPESRYAYRITLKNGKIIKIWAHHYKNLYKLEGYFSIKNPYIRRVKKNKKINEETMRRMTFLITLK